MKRNTIIIIGAFLALATAPAAADREEGVRRGRAFTATWATAQLPPSALEFGAPNWSLPGFADQTLRQVVRISVGGAQLRVRLSNLYGTGPLRIAGATIGRVAEGPTTAGVTIRGRLRTLTFSDGQATAEIPAGQELASDALRLETSDLERLAVTLYLAEPTGPATYHMLAQATTFRAPGNHLADQTTAAFTESTQMWFFLTGVEVSGPRCARAVAVAFGDSITDGAFSTVDGNHRYPDALAERVLASGKRLAVLNTGIGGDRLLTDTCFGERGTARFARDVLDRPGARSAVVLLGINDILAPAVANIPDFAACAPQNPTVTADQLIEGHRTLIRAAHARGLKIVGGTLTPYKGSEVFTDAGEVVRAALNAWIRGGGEYDAVVDFEAAVADPADPTRMRPAFDSGDKLHPNDAGLKAMADAVDLATL